MGDLYGVYSSLFGFVWDSSRVTPVWKGAESLEIEWKIALSVKSSGKIVSLFDAAVNCGRGRGDRAQNQRRKKVEAKGR